MEQITKVVILSDENTTKTGRIFGEQAEKLFEKKEINVRRVSVDTVKDIANAIRQFDSISDSNPDLLIVIDFACIGMQSMEEEPLYNNMTIPVVHVLFRRPWEYPAFMIWRCNFIDRFYTLIPEDAAHIRAYYKNVHNALELKRDLFFEPIRAVWSSEQEAEVLEQSCLALPDYIKVIAHRWAAVMEREKGGEEEALKKCLQEIGFACSEQEYLDILYMLREVFLLYEKKQEKKLVTGEYSIREEVLEQQLEEFSNTDFPVSLL